MGEKKSITAVVDPGPDEVRLGPVTAEFLRILPGLALRARERLGRERRAATPLIAWATLGHALTQLAPGNTLFVGAGTYGDPLLDHDRGQR